MREERGRVLELARYLVLNPVRAGMCAVPEQWPWSSYRAMVGLYQGDAEFADKSRQTLSNRLLNDAEIPRLQRRARVPPLEVFAAMPDRNSAISKAYASGRYSQKEIASAFEIHYATVSRIVKVKTDLPSTPP